MYSPKVVFLSLFCVFVLSVLSFGLIYLAPRLGCQQKDLRIIFSKKHSSTSWPEQLSELPEADHAAPPGRKPILPVTWRTHHIFNGSINGRLHGCPLHWPEELQLWKPPKHLKAVSQLLTAANDSKKEAARQDAAGSVVAQASREHGAVGLASRHAPGKTLPYTREALKIVWQHQHPADCSNAKFVTYIAAPSGIGSVLHVQTMVLRSALDSGRIMIEMPGHFLASTAYCGANNTLGSCYFHPTTNCTLTSSEMSQALLLSTHDEFRRLLARDAKLPRVVRIQPGGEFMDVFLDNPLIFEGFLSTTSIPKGLLREGASHRLWWWRAIGAAYIVRPNEQTYRELAVRMNTKVIGAKLSSGCIGLYIRHGDKHVETPVYSDQQYEEAVNKLRSIDPDLTRQLFLSTEDAGSIAYYRNASRAWSTTYVDMPMKFASKSNLAYMQERGYHEEVLNGLLNLQLILECSGFVGSMYSNWARLIEELRSTVWCKADAVYFDVHIQAPVGFHYVI